jgi:tetratricopeptide (TPR) repeat protein
MSFEPESQLPVHLSLDDHAGPATRISRERAQAMVERALQAMPPAAASGPSPRRLTAPAMLTAAAGVLIVLIGGLSAAHVYFRVGTEAPQAARSQQLPMPQATGSQQLPMSQATGSQQLPTPPAAEPEVPSEPALSAQPDAELPSEPSEPSEPIKAPHASRIITRDMDDLLQKANHLRSAGQFRAAAQTYGLVYERFPRTFSAYVARIAAGSIELEHLSNPTHARRLFEQALHDRPSGALDLEAQQGLSVALRDLEDRPAEVRALQTLVAAHPDSPAARRAQVRLREIGTAAQ